MILPPATGNSTGGWMRLARKFRMIRSESFQKRSPTPGVFQKAGEKNDYLF
jgi:hypothetical protein